ncbi:MAG: hypothetical protein IT164_17060 [Bryobacterales bacterium]|nr:hypothetical protein [Bryobacterales bacterium]
MRRLALLPLPLLLASCGYVGDPLPPSLHIPATVSDLRAEQKADQIEIRFTLPALTTDHAGIRRFQDVELTGGATGSEGRIPLPPAAPGPVVLTVPVAGWSGKTAVFRVRSQGARGRWSEWSQPVTLAVAAPIPAPTVRAEATARGVRLSWEAAPGAQYRIFRTGPGETTATEIGATTEAVFLDQAATFGQSYSYEVQAAGSPRSAPALVTPSDTFPPDAPAGLSAIASPGAVQLTWNPVEDSGLAAYQVYRAEAGGGFVRAGGRLPSPNFGDREVRPGTAYQYRVTAIDTAGNESAPSETVTATTP